jgi:hypothetical protein
MEDGTIFIVYLSRGHAARCCLFYPFVDCSFQLCNNWLCTSSDVEAGFNYPLSKKSHGGDYWSGKGEISSLSTQGSFGLALCDGGAEVGAGGAGFSSSSNSANLMLK